MTETRQLTVTQQDIDNGVRCSAHMCPFATAAQRLFGCTVTVVNYRVSNWDRTSLPPDMLVWENSQFWLLPQEVDAIIEQYDLTGEMSPGTYEIKKRT
jgi:hypothetical protein